MGWKEFLKPDWKKLLLFLILGIALFFIEWSEQLWWPQCADCYSYQGIPLPIYSSGGFTGETTFHLIFLLINILIWYFISVIVVFGVNKLRKR